MKKLSLLVLAAVVVLAGSGIYANAVEPGRDMLGERQIVERNRHRPHRGRGGVWFNFGYRPPPPPRPRPYYGHYYAPPPPPPTYYYTVPAQPYYYSTPVQPYGGGVVIVR